MPVDECLVESRALVAAPSMSSREALPVVPVKERLGKRRVHRPFSVAEIETVVQAVEKLGTGRCASLNSFIIIFEAVQTFLLICQHIFFGLGSLKTEGFMSDGLQFCNVVSGGGVMSKFELLIM